MLETRCLTFVSCGQFKQPNNVFVKQLHLDAFRCLGCCSDMCQVNTLARLTRKAFRNQEKFVKKLPMWGLLTSNGCLFEIWFFFDRTKVQLHIHSAAMCFEFFFNKRRGKGDYHPVSHSVYACSAYVAVDLDWRKRPRADGLGHPVLLDFFDPMCNHQINPDLFAASCSRVIVACSGIALLWHDHHRWNRLQSSWTWRFCVRMRSVA